MNSSPERKSQLAKIHIGAKALGWSDAEYRRQLYSVCRVDSSADLDEYGRKRFIQHLVAEGWKPTRPSRKSAGRPHNYGRSRLIRKIEALLADAGRRWAYADSLARKLTKPRKERLAFCDEHDLRKIVAALELDARRRLTRDIQQLLDYLGLTWWDAHRIAEQQKAITGKQKLETNTQAMSLVRRKLNDKAQEACDL